MSYSNPGYAVAAHVLERVTGRAYEDVIRDRIFMPIGMTTSSFRLEDSDLPLLARGYDGRRGPPVPFSQIYLRPAGNLHTSARELGTFVQLLLNWGETEKDLVIDPEYLSNMERPRTSLSARAGLIYGYGSGIASRSVAGFPVLGHGGGVDGFVSSFGYSAARDAGWVVLVNADYSESAVDRLSELAVRYLKRDVEPPIRFPQVGGEVAADESCRRQAEQLLDDQALQVSAPVALDGQDFGGARSVEHVGVAALERAELQHSLSGVTTWLVTPLTRTTDR